jgi:hypothetical protein
MAAFDNRREALALALAAGRRVKDAAGACAVSERAAQRYRACATCTGQREVSLPPSIVKCIDCSGQGVVPAGR